MTGLSATSPAASPGPPRLASPCRTHPLLPRSSSLRQVSVPLPPRAMPCSSRRGAPSLLPSAPFSHALLAAVCSPAPGLRGLRDIPTAVEGRPPSARHSRTHSWHHRSSQHSVLARRAPFLAHTCASALAHRIRCSRPPIGSQLQPAPCLVAVAGPPPRARYSRMHRSQQCTPPPSPTPFPAPGFRGLRHTPAAVKGAPPAASPSRTHSWHRCSSRHSA